MISLERMAHGLAEVIAATGPAAPAILFFATFVEYVFPPFPGDLLVLLGAWYAVQGALSWPMTFVSVTAGALAGAWLDYRIGAAVGRRIERRVAERRESQLALRVARFEASYRRFGAWLLVANRFLPGVRAVVFLAAGASRLPLGKVLACGALSAALWNALLLTLGGLLAHNLDELQLLFRQYTRAAGVAVVVGLALLLVGAWVRRRRTARAAASEPDRP